MGFAARSLAGLLLFSCLGFTQPRQLFISGVDAGYIDSAVCANCHREIADNYARTGMGRSFQAVRAETRLPGFEGNRFTHTESKENFTAYRRDGAYYLRRHQLGPGGAITNVLDERVDYEFGSGNHARSYLHRTPGGKLVELPLTWYTENGGYWGMSPSYDRSYHLGFSRLISYRCMFCHNGYPEIAQGSDDRDIGTEFTGRLPEGIDCQRCHGPGRDHVEAVKKGDVRRARASIVNPAALTPERQIELCMQCHLETESSLLPASRLRYGRGVFSYRPGQPLADYILHFDEASETGHGDKFQLVSAVYGLRKSACFRASPAMTCMTCHDPHRISHGQEAMQEYSHACLECHAGKVTQLVRDRQHTAEQNCVACHMPKRRPSDNIHLSMTDHEILAKPRPLRDPVREQHDDDKPPYYGEVMLYYPRTLAKTPDNEIDVAIAQVKHQSNLPAGVYRLEALIQQYHPERRDAYFELAEAYFQGGQVEKAIPYYREAVKRPGARWYEFSALGRALTAAGQPGDGIPILQQALKLAPLEPTVLYAIAQNESAQGRFEEATALFRRLRTMDSEMAEGSNNLGNILLRIGDLAGAEAALREALRLRPEVPAIHLNLAGTLLHRGELAEAKYHLEEAIRIGPSFEEARSAYLRVLLASGSVNQARGEYALALSRQTSDMHSNLGSVQLALGNNEEALRQYRLATDNDPASALAHLNLGLTLAGVGKTDEARRALETAVRLNPELYEAHLNLGELLIAEGETASAALHLKRAAASSNPQVRKAAADLLARL